MGALRRPTGTFVAARDKSLAEALSDESLRRQMRPKFVLGGREVAHYPFHGHNGASHSRVVIESPDGAPIFDLVLAERPAPIPSSPAGQLQPVGRPPTRHLRLQPPVVHTAERPPGPAGRLWWRQGPDQLVFGLGRVLGSRNR